MRPVFYPCSTCGNNGNLVDSDTAGGLDLTATAMESSLGRGDDRLGDTGGESVPPIISQTGSYH